MITVKANSTLASVSELRTKFEEILAHLKDTQVILERHNRPLAVMVAYSEYQKFEALLELAEDLVLGTIAHERDRASKKGDFVDLDQWK